MYKCPKCGKTDRLDVCVDVWVRLVQPEDDPECFETDADETEQERGHHWDGNHGMICAACDHGGNVSDFEIAPCNLCGAEGVNLNVAGACEGGCEDDDAEHNSGEDEDDEDDEEACLVCGETEEMNSGDCYCGLCPSCADKANEIADDQELEWDDAVEKLKEQMGNVCTQCGAKGVPVNSFDGECSDCEESRADRVTEALEEGDVCRGCGRDSLDCSKDPCRAVIRDRGEKPVSCNKCGKTHSESDSHIEYGTGAEHGVQYFYCSDHCKETH